MAEIAGGEWFAKRCPTRDITIAPTDRGTLWLVRYIDHGKKCMGEIAITQGEYAESHARLFAAAPALLQEVERVLESTIADIDNLDCDAHGWNGGVSDCEHCHLCRYRDHLKELIEKATAHVRIVPQLERRDPEDEASVLELPEGEGGFN